MFDENRKLDHKIISVSAEHPSPKEIQCNGCSIEPGDADTLRVIPDSREFSKFELSMPTATTHSGQKIRVEFAAFDYRAGVEGDDPGIWFEFFIRYSDNTESKAGYVEIVVKNFAEKY